MNQQQVSTIDPRPLEPPAPATHQGTPTKTPAEPSATSSPEEPSAFMPPAVVELPTETPRNLPAAPRQRFPRNLAMDLNLILAQNGKAYSIQRRNGGNPYVLPVGSRQLDNIIRGHAHNDGINLRKNDLSDINAMLQAEAETAGIRGDAWNRIAPIPGGVEIDLGDDELNRVRITAGNVELVESGSEILFFRTPFSLPMVRPAETGDLDRLKKYLNLHPIDVTLLIAWMTYTLAHPKVPTSKFVHLVIMGGEGVGKSFLCHLISTLIDPNHVVLQKMPGNDKDLAIVAQNSHVPCLDNIRNITPAMGDNFCIASTGGVLASRQLYTDADMAVLNLHCAFVLNGIHPFITQQDLAQRCLTIHPQLIAEANRKSETVLMQQFQDDLPYVMRGLFDLISEIFKHYGSVETTNPERMIDFSRWLAAMEKAHGAPAGVYQEAYSESLRNGRLDGLQENELGAAMLDFADELDGETWQGTPDELLHTLNGRASKGTLRSKDWPLNPISLSKKLAVLQAGLKSQGIDITFTRGKKRRITINTTQN